MIENVSGGDQIGNENSLCAITYAERDIVVQTECINPSSRRLMHIWQFSGAKIIINNPQAVVKRDVEKKWDSTFRWVILHYSQHQERSECLSPTVRVFLGLLWCTGCAGSLQIKKRYEDKLAIIQHTLTFHPIREQLNAIPVCSYKF